MDIQWAMPPHQWQQINRVFERYYDTDNTKDTIHTKDTRDEGIAKNDHCGRLVKRS